MFRKLATLTLFAFTPLIAALTLQGPSTTWYSQQEVTIKWTSQASDPVFSLYLINKEFHDSFGIANNVRPTDGQITLTLPVLVPRDGYTLRAVNIGDINDVYSETGVFSIAPNPSTTSSGTSAGTSSGTGTSTGTSTRPSGTSSTTGTGTPLTSLTTTPTSRPVTSTPGPTTTAGTFNGNGAGTFKINSQVTAFAAVAISVVAGAAVFAL